MYRSTIVAAMAFAVLSLAFAATVPARAESAGKASNHSRSLGKADTATTSRAGLNRSTNFRTGPRHRTVRHTAAAKPTKKATTRKQASAKAAPRKQASVSKPIHHKASTSIVAAIKTHARAAGVPVSVAMAVIKHESNFNPRATGKAGEIGLMQVKCRTARGEGFKGACSSLYNVDNNLRYGMRYLKKALNRGSVAYFNAGIHAKKLPAAARTYARRVASLY